MTAAFAAVTFGILVFGSITVAPIYHVHPAVVFTFMVGVLIGGLFFIKLDDFSNGNVGADE